MFLAHTVAEAELVGLAGAAAVVEVFALGERGGEDAMLRMEHGHVLVNDSFVNTGIGAIDHGGELAEIQVVAGDHAEDAHGAEYAGGELVGDVEGVISDEGEDGGLFLKEADGGEVAREDHVGLAIFDLLEEAFFVRLDDADGGEGEGDTGFAGFLDGGFVLADVFKVGVEGGGAFQMSGDVCAAPSEGGVELVEVADHDVHVGYVSMRNGEDAGLERGIHLEAAGGFDFLAEGGEGVGVNDGMNGAGLTFEGQSGGGLTAELI